MAKYGIICNFVRKKNGKDSDEIKIESYEPWYEFENENELKSYIRLTNEDLDNFIRWQALEIILNEKEEDPFEK